MRTAVITYDSRHLKTEQVMLGLHENGYRGIDLFALPFVPRKGRDVAFAHRPDMSTGAHSRDVAKALDCKYTVVDGPDGIPTDYDVMLVAGAGILPDSLVSKVKIVNAHAGLIPSVRGLDSFKWAILEGMPLGVTLHLIDAKVDAGEVLSAMRTPMFSTDTIEDVARRHYEIEISLLVNFLTHLENPKGPAPDLTERPARMRMPLNVEWDMLARFEAYKGSVCVK